MQISSSCVWLAEGKAIPRAGRRFTVVGRTASRPLCVCMVVCYAIAVVMLWFVGCCVVLAILSPNCRPGCR